MRTDRLRIGHPKLLAKTDVKARTFIVRRHYRRTQCTK